MEKIELNVIIRNFADGDRRAFIRPKVTDDDILAKCLWFLNHGRPEEAEMLLESYC